MLVAAVLGFVGVVALALVLQLLAPSDAEILERATPAKSAWSAPGRITHYTTVVAQTNPVTGQPEKLRREHWSSADGTVQRMTTVRVGTPRTFSSIYEPDSMRIGNIAEETSSTSTTNPRYRVSQIDTAEGLATNVDTASAARHGVWWGPCGSCHEPELDAEMLATAQAGAPPYLAASNRSALRVVGRGRVRGRRTYVLEANRPSRPEGYREVTRIDVDQATYLPLRYRIEIVQSLGSEGTDVIDTTEIDVTSHETMPAAELGAGWSAVQLPASAAYAARQSFDASQAVVWPPVDAVPSQEPSRPVVYDLGEGYPILGGRMTGVRFRPADEPIEAEGGRLGRPDAVVEELHPKPGVRPMLRVLTEYGEAVAPGEDHRFSRTPESLDNGWTYSPLLWVITLPKVSDAEVREWARGGSIKRITVAGGEAWEIRGATIEDSLRPFDYGAVVAQTADATVVITQPPNVPDAPELVRQAADQLTKRQ